MGLRLQARRTVAVILIVAGAIAMFVSTQLDRIWWILVWFMIGMTCLSLLLLQISDTLEVRLRRDPARWWPFAFGGMAAVGLGVVALAIRWQLSPIVAIGGMVLITLGIVGVFLWFSRSATVGDLGREDEPSIGVGSAAWHGFELMAVGIGLILISDGTATLIGAIAWLVGLVTVKIGSKAWLESRGAELDRTVRILIDVTLVGLFVLFAGAFGSVWVLVLVGLSIVVAALSMLGVGALQLEHTIKKAYWAMGLAFAAMVGVWVWMAVVTQNPGLAFVLGLMVALAGGFFVLRGEGIVLLMMLGYIIAWGLVDRSVTLDEAAPIDESAPVRIVALGDSFISGEGANEFFAGTNDVGGNQCRRAPTAHPYLVAEALDVNVVSLACSGAKVADLVSCGQMWPEGRRCRVEPPAVASEGEGESEAEPDAVPVALEEIWDDALAVDDGDPPGALPQLVSAIDRKLNESADVVLLSIGGNDVGFSSIVKACLLPKGCDERREIWLDSIDLLGPQLDEAYATIGATFSQATVVVMPYPMLVNAEPRTRCDLGLSQSEREFVVDFIQKLDVTIADAAGRAGFVYVDDAATAYDGFQLCDDAAGANHLKLVPPEGSKLGRYSPATWIPGSMHPNTLGHQLTAGATVCTVAEHLEIAAASGSIAGSRDFSCEVAGAAPEPAGGVGATVDGEDGTVQACEAALAPGGAPSVQEARACAAVSSAVDEQIEEQIDELAVGVAVVADELVSDDEWIRDELFRTVRALALPVLLLLALGMVFAWGFAQLGNPVSRFLRQERARFVPTDPTSVRDQFDDTDLDTIRSDLPGTGAELEGAVPLPDDEEVPPASNFAFIAYPREEAAYVERLAEFLESEGIPVWYDRRLKVGEVWLTKILERVGDSSAFVVVSTPDTQTSQYIKLEVLKAMDTGKEFFPILLRGQPIDFVAHVQMEDLRPNAIFPRASDMPSPAFVQALRDQLSTDGPERADAEVDAAVQGR